MCSKNMYKIIFKPLAYLLWQRLYVIDKWIMANISSVLPNILFYLQNTKLNDFFAQLTYMHSFLSFFLSFRLLKAVEFTYPYGVVKIHRIFFTTLNLEILWKTHGLLSLIKLNGVKHAPSRQFLDRKRSNKSNYTVIWLVRLKIRSLLRSSFILQLLHK